MGKGKLDQHWLELIVGLALLVSGVIGTIQKRFSFGLGRSPTPNSTITLTESRAVVFSRLCIVEGGIIVALWLLVFMGDKILGRWLGAVAAAGLIIDLLVFAVCSIYELSEPSITIGSRQRPERDIQEYPVDKMNRHLQHGDIPHLGDDGEIIFEKRAKHRRRSR